jgi:peptidoglycan/xylan/chitin deacetylase (PgdA/CDA1 family)
MTEDAGLYVTYIFESAGFKNTLGYYTFNPLNPPNTPEDIDDMTIIFPNSSMLGSGGALERGHTVFLGDFTAGTGIGFFLISNGWKDGDVTKGLYSHYTHYDMNAESDPSIRQHTVLLKDLDRDLLVMGFEDVSRKYASCDQDFDDAVFLIHSDPKNAYVTHNIPDLDTTASSKSKEQVTVFSEMKGWTPWYNEGYSEDNNIFVSGRNSGKITINSNLTGARLVQAPTDFSNKSIRIRFRAEDWSALTEFSIRFYTDEASNEGYVLNFRDYFFRPNNEEWYDIVFPRSAFEGIGSSPDWSTVSNIYIRGNSNTNTAVYIDEILLVDDKPFEGVVTLSFDDGYDDVFVEAASYMKKTGYLGTAFIMPEQIGELGYMNEAQLNELNAQGWGIGGHHITNLRTLNLADAEIAISNVKNWLKERSYNGQEHFAYPMGSYNKDIQNIIMKYFTTARTIDGFNQPFACIIPENINSRTISNITTVSTLKAQIDEAIIHNEWLILNFHKLVEMPSNDIEYSILDFKEIVDYLFEKGVTVMPYHVVLKEFCEK